MSRIPRAVTQHTPTPEQFKNFIQGAKDLADQPRGQKRARLGTKKLLEQLGLDETLNAQALTELASQGYGEAVGLLQAMENVLES